MATIKDIAREAGVSIATVSHVVNKTRYVSPKLVEKVEAAIRELNSTPNFIARKNKALGILPNTRYLIFLVSDLQDTLSRKIYHELNKKASSENFCLLPFEYGENFHVMDFCQYLLVTISHIAGIFIMVENQDTALAEYVHAMSCPVVLIGTPLDGIHSNTVQIDYADGAYKAVNHLIRRGHKNITIFTDTRQELRGREIISGAVRSMEKHGIMPFPQNLVSCTISRKDVFQQMQNLLQKEQPTTAILAANPILLREIFSYMKTEALNCPQDISIIAFDDYECAGLYSPPVTTLTQDIKKLTDKAFQLLLQQLNNKDNPSKSQTEVSPYILSVRDSTLGVCLGPFGEIAALPEEALLTEKEKAQVREKHYTAVVSFHSTSRAFMQLVERGIRSVFDTLDISLLALTDAQFDPDMQRKQIESLLLLQPDLFISMPSDSYVLSDAYRKIVESNSKLIFIGDNIPIGLTPNDYVTSVSDSEYSIGQCIGNAIGEYMKYNNLNRIAFIIHGQDSFYKAQQRDSHVQQVLKEEYTDIDIVETVTFQQENIYQITQELITRNPEIKILYISWERPATYALSALSDMSREDISIITMDLDYEVAMNMAQGKSVKAICGEHPFDIGFTAAYAGASALIGKNVPSFFVHSSKIITRDNLLKSWQETFLEQPPQEMVTAVNQSLFNSSNTTPAKKN